MDIDSFILSVKPKGIIRGLKNLEDIFGFGNLNKNHDLFSNKNKKVLGKYQFRDSYDI